MPRPPRHPTSLLARLIGTLEQGAHELRMLRQACQNHPSPAAVHRLRVAIRRLLAGLDLTRGLPAARSRRTARRALRNLLRALGPARDAAVSRKLAATLHPRPAGVSGLETQLRRRAVRLAAALAQTLGHSRPHRAVARYVKKLRRAIRHRAGRLAEVSVVIAADTRSRRRLAHRWPRSTAEDRAFHRARIAVKRRRYLLELFAALGRTPGPAELKRLHQLQRILGAWHDGAVLGAHTQRLAGRGKISPALAAAVAKSLAGRRVRLRRRGLAAGRWIRTA